MAVETGVQMSVAGEVLKLNRACDDNAIVSAQPVQLVQLPDTDVMTLPVSATHDVAGMQDEANLVRQGR
jgi:hypothetical protein